MLQSIFSLFKKETKSYPVGSIHSFVVKSLQGNDFNFSTLEGKKVMIVNTASKCGLTPQYEKLQQLYDKYKSENFEIIGFPANNFLWQEPGNANDIQEFCSINYGVTFPMMEKISVKGKNMHPIYEFLTRKSKNGVMNSSVKWNFQKYLLNENGELEKVISPKTQPDDRSIVDWIEGE
jgi:glutathione peroxidase